MHAVPFVEDLKEQQARLIASYHETHDVNDFNSDQAHMIELYERAALPIQKGDMALTNIAFISLTVFACSLVASMRELGAPPSLEESLKKLVTPCLNALRSHM